MLFQNIGALRSDREYPLLSWRKIAITLIDTEKSRGKTHTRLIAWLQQSGAPLRLAQEPGQAFSEGVVQAAMLLQHGCSIAPWDFVDMHRNLDHGAIQCEECVYQLIGVTSPDTVGKQLLPWLFL